MCRLLVMSTQALDSPIEPALIVHVPRPVIVAMGGALPATQTREAQERCLLERKSGLFSEEGPTGQIDKCAQKPADCIVPAPRL